MTPSIMRYAISYCISPRDPASMRLTATSKSCSCLWTFCELFVSSLLIMHTLIKTNQELTLG